VWNFGVKAVATVSQRGSSMFRSPRRDSNDNLRISVGPLQIVCDLSPSAKTIFAPTSEAGGMRWCSG
jgi:hypothetical protein